MLRAALRRLSGSATASSAASSASTSTNASTNTTVETIDAPIDGVSILSLSSPPVNVLTSDVMKNLLNELRRLADSASGCRGVVLTSSLPTTFSSGLDLNVFTREPFDAAGFAHYWAQFQELFVTLHSYPLPLVAAINGHAPAAGCIIACACDYRVMARRADTVTAGGADTVTSTSRRAPRDFVIGITAARGGFAAPPYVARNLAHIVGTRVAESMLTSGLVLTADEAHKVGLIDEVVDEAGQTVVAALEEVERYLQMPMEHTRWLVKDHMRRPLLWDVKDKEGRAQDCVAFADMLQSPSVRSDLRSYVASLSKKAKS